MTRVEQLTFNPFQENTFVVYDDSGECVIIDPGCYERHEEQELVEFIQEKELTPVRLLSTHSHIDHVLGNDFVCKSFDLKPECHQEDLETLKNVVNYAHVYGFGGYKPSPEPENFIEVGDLEFGQTKFEVRFVPGHAPGHVVFINHKEKFIINGDCLFYGSIGRTDLPGGDHQTLLDSIQRELYSLPDDYKVYCGHGPATSIGFEKVNNPFVKGN